MKTRGNLYLAVAFLSIGTIIIFLSRAFDFLLPYYVISTMLFLGMTVFSRSPRNRLNISFFTLTILIVFWAISIFMFWQSNSSAAAFFWSIMANASGVFIPAFFVQFVNFLPRKVEPSTILDKLLWFGPATLLMVAVFARLVIRDVIMSADGYSVVPGSLFLLFLFYFILYLGAGFLLLVRKYRIHTGKIRMQLQYVFLGSFLGSFFPFITNLVLPLLGNSSLTRIGPYFTLIFVAFTAYAIVRHRLMSIEIVIQRGAVYGFATVLIMAFYALAVIFSETFLRSVMGYTSLFVTAGAALLIAILYHPMIGGVQSLADRVFFRERYDYQKTLRAISQKIASVIKLEELGRLIVSSFIDTMKVSEISFLLREKDKEHFRSVALSLPRYIKIEIGANNPLAGQLYLAKDILVKEEVDIEISRLAALGNEGLARRLQLEEVRDEMKRLGIPLWIPIISKDELIGIIALGQKLSGDIFTTEDMGLLSTLASQMAVALDNARLYDEVVNMKDYSEKILQSMINGMLTVNTRGKIVTCNFMCEKITGRKEDEILGKTCEDVWGKRGIITNIIENTLNNGKSYVNFEARLASPERGFVPVSFSSTALLDHQGKKMGALLSIQDLSEVKELEGKVRQADKLGALATMAAGMAHEIKNPLSSIKVLSQLLPKKINDAGYRKKLTEIMPREINRIDRIVESLLGFARATTLKFEMTDIKEILEYNLRYFEDQTREEEIVIIRKYEELPLVEVDKEQISQVFSNLMLNAMQAMPDGGELKIEAFAGKSVEGLIRQVKVRVSDTGYGISEDTVKKLFDPFFTTKYGGTGLGLTITHSIVDAHKGYIDVESKVGKGTSFTVTLPVSQGLV